jgi:hypothetical protein
MTKASPDGRHVFFWHGRDRAQDQQRLAEAIADSIELFNQDGSLVGLSSKGELVPIGFENFRKLVATNICGLRLKQNGANKWEREYFTYEFNAPPGPDMREGGRRPIDNSTPDSIVLNEIYLHELKWRIPKV